jgi:hypothetical protein
MYLLLFDHSFCSNDVFLIVHVYMTVCCWLEEEKRA